MTGKYWRLVASVGVAALLVVAPTGAALAVATAPSLGSAQSFAVLGNSAVTNAGAGAVVTGDLGVSPGSSCTGFPSPCIGGGAGIVIGAIHLTDVVAASAHTASTTAWGNLAGEACDFGPFGAVDLASAVLPPGVYCYSSILLSAGAVTLDALGDPNAVWVFKIGS